MCSPRTWSLELTLALFGPLQIISRDHIIIVLSVKPYSEVL